MDTFLVCAIITTLSAFISLGFSIAAVVDRTTRQYGLYTLSRSLAIAVAAAVVLARHSHDWMVAIALIMILVQAFDAVIGGIKKAASQTVGPVVLSLANLIVLWWYLAK